MAVTSPKLESKKATDKQFGNDNLTIRVTIMKSVSGIVIFRLISHKLGTQLGQFCPHLSHLGPHLGDRGVHFGHNGLRLRRNRQDVAKKCQGPPEFGLRGSLLKKYHALNGGVDVFFFVGMGLSLQSHLYSVPDNSVVGFN